VWSDSASLIVICISPTAVCSHALRCLLDVYCSWLDRPGSSLQALLVGLCYIGMPCRRGGKSRFTCSPGSGDSTAPVLTIGSSDRGVWLRWAKEKVDDWDKSASFCDNAPPRRSTSSLDAVMRDNLNIKPPLRLEWWRFGVLASLIALVFAGVIALPRHRPNDLPTTLAVVILGASLICFFAYRFYKLRVEIREGRFLLEEFRQNPRRYIRGPLGVVVVWFSCTLGLALGIVVYSALHR